MKAQSICLAALILLTGCNRDGIAAPSTVAMADAADTTPPAASKSPFSIAEIATFDEPWALAFLPDGRVLVTEKKGKLKLLQRGGESRDVTGVPAVDYGGQGGLGDIALDPGFADNGRIYLSYVEKGDGDARGAAVASAQLRLDAEGGATLDGLSVIWRQDPKLGGTSHFSHRIAFGPDGKLWITSGERAAATPAQDMHGNLGKVLRLNADASVPADNPFAGDGGPVAQAWSIGHRNMLGIDFDAQGRPWVVEMGPRGGDELNLVLRGRNYGWPIVSNGNNYDGSDIPDHPTQPGYEKPKVSWTPVIAPSSLLIYSGDAFPNWKGDALIGGLASQALVRVEFDGDKAREAARYDMGKRIRAVEQGPGGGIYLLEDGSGGRLLNLVNPDTAK